MGLSWSLGEAIYTFKESAPEFPIWFVYILLAGIPVTLVHELGHAVVAQRRLGSEIDVSVGTAGAIAEFRLGQINTTIKILSDPTRAAGATYFPDSEATVRDVIWIALAGPLATLVGIVLTALLYSIAPDQGIVHDFLWAALFAGTFVFLFTLIPFVFQERRGGPKERSDGRVALDALKVLREIR